MSLLSTHLFYHPINTIIRLDILYNTLIVQYFSNLKNNKYFIDIYIFK